MQPLAIQTVKRALKWSLWRSGLVRALARAGRGGSEAQRLIILNYHHVSAGPGGPADTPFETGVAAREFQQQVRYLAAHHSVVDLAEAARRLAAGEALPRPAVCLTFDDGYADVYQHAYPVLRRLGLPATVFVSTAYVGSDHVPWWAHLSRMVMKTDREELDTAGLEALQADAAARQPFALGTRSQRLKALAALNEAMKHMPEAGHDPVLQALSRRLGVPLLEGQPGVWMGWEHLAEMARHGITIGAHTVRHPNVALLGPDEQRAEIVGSKQRIAEAIGEPPRLFAYPFGLFDASARGIVAEHFAAACSSERGANGADADPYALRRISLGWQRLWDLAFLLAFPDGPAARRVA